MFVACNNSCVFFNCLCVLFCLGPVLLALYVRRRYNHLQISSNMSLEQSAAASSSVLQHQQPPHMLQPHHQIHHQQPLVSGTASPNSAAHQHTTTDLGGGFEDFPSSYTDLSLFHFTHHPYSTSLQATTGGKKKRQTDRQTNKQIAVQVLTKDLNIG